MNHIGNNFIVDERPYRIMDQHNVVWSGLELGKRIGHRFLAVFSTFYHLYLLRQFFFFQLPGEAFHLILP